jgi:hypothetical protein
MSFDLIDPNQLARRVLFPVLEIPIPRPTRPISFNQDGSGFNFNSQSNSKYKMIVREDTLEPISVMTEQYQLVSNDDVLQIMANKLRSSEATVHEANVFGNARTRITFDIPKTVVRVRGEAMMYRITLLNSYDGTAKIALRPGLLRLVCLNGMVAAQEFSLVSYKHLKSQEITSGIEELVDQAIETINTNIIAEVEFMMSVKIRTKENIIKFMSYLPQTTNEDFVSVLAKEEQTYWGLLNASTYVLTHISKRDNESSHKVESMVYRAALTMARKEY